jgi:hypothetical protein
MRHGAVILFSDILIASWAKSACELRLQQGRDDEANKTLKLHLRRAPYRPSMVVQAMVKMALSIMPEEEMLNFQQSLGWIRPDNTLTRMVAPTPFFYTFISGPMASDLITVALMTRRNDDFVTPYCFLLLVYGQEMLQMVIPSIEKDRHHFGKRMEFRRFPCFRDEGAAAMAAPSGNRYAVSVVDWTAQFTVPACYMRA